MSARQFKRPLSLLCISVLFLVVALRPVQASPHAPQPSAPHLSVPQPSGAALRQQGRIAAGFGHSVYVDENGIAWFWGRNIPTASGNWIDKVLPKPVLKNVRAVAAEGEYVLFFLYDNSIWAWGSNSSKQFGNPPVPEKLIRPERVLENVSSIVTIVPGFSRLFLLMEDKSLWESGLEWGDTRQNPHKVAENVLQAARPWHQNIFLSYTDGRVRYMGFGDNYNAQLNGTDEPEKQLTPKEFNIPGIDAESIAELHTRAMGSLAVLKNGEVWQWGMFCLNRDMHDVALNSTAPSKVIGLPPVRTIAARDCYFLALTPEGDVWEADVYEDAPRLVMHDAAEIAVGLYHSVVLKKDGTVWCWGGNYFGQIDLSEEDYHKEPVQMRFPWQR